MRAGDVLQLVRPDLRDLGSGYVPAAPDFRRLRLHANESPWDDDDAGAGGVEAGSAASAGGAVARAGLNRYPPARASALEARLAEVYGIAADHLMVTRGSDDGIDLLVRAFCRAGQDAVLVSPPTFGMYAHAARVQNARCLAVPLLRETGWSLAAEAVLAAVRSNRNVRLVFLCSPNNPTGNVLDAQELLALSRALAGRAALAVDEAYVEFTGGRGLVDHAGTAGGHPNLIVVRTLSKAYGLAGVRCGALVADPALIGLLGRLAPPYSTPSPVIDAVMARLTPAALARMHEQLALIGEQRRRLAGRLERLPFVQRVWPSQANFLLVDVDDGERLVRACHEADVLIRRFADKPELGEAVRISVGTPAQVDRLLDVLEELA